MIRDDKRMNVYKVTFSEDVRGHYFSMEVEATSRVEALIHIVNSRHVYAVESVERIR